MTEPRMSLAKLQADVQSLAKLTQRHALYVDLAEGELSLHGYQLMLWVLRQVHKSVEAQAAASRTTPVKAVRKHLTLKRPQLERDLVAACGYSLTVPRALSAVLDSKLAGFNKPTTPARVLGRLLFLEAILMLTQEVSEGLDASAHLPVASRSYLNGRTDSAAFLATFELFAESLVGEVAQTNAFQAARDLSECMFAAFDTVIGSIGAAGLQERSA